MPKLARAFALTLATSLALPQGVALASFNGPAEAGPSEAEQLYRQGKTHYEIGEYEKALEFWKQAYAKVDDNAENLQVRHALVYNIAEAEMQVFEISQDITHLRRAKTLLDRYLSNHQSLYGDSEGAVRDRADAQEKLDEVTARIAEAEAAGLGRSGGESSDPPAEGPEPAEATEEGELDLAQATLARREAIKNDPELRRKDKMYTGFIYGGGAAIGVGAVLVIVAGPVGLATAAGNAASDPFGGPYFDGTGGVVAVSGLLVAAGGVGLLTAGVVLRKKHRKPQLQARFAPYGSREGFGAAARFSF